MTSGLQKTTRGWDLWPVCIVGFFAVAIIGCVSFVLFCMLNPTDLVAEDYYQRELKHDAQMKRVENARFLGGAVSISYHETTRRLTVKLPKAHTRASGGIHLYRPSAKTLDRRLKLELDETGSQSVDVESLMPGLWQVKIQWMVDGQEYFVDEKFSIGKTPQTLSGNYRGSHSPGSGQTAGRGSNEGAYPSMVCV